MCTHIEALCEFQNTDCYTFLVILRNSPLFLALSIVWVDFRYKYLQYNYSLWHTKCNKLFGKSNTTHIHTHSCTLIFFTKTHIRP